MIEKILNELGIKFITWHSNFDNSEVYAIELKNKHSNEIESCLFSLVEKNNNCSLKCYARLRGEFIPLKKEEANESHIKEIIVKFLEVNEMPEN